jgi:hypothetical protein
LCSLTLRRGFLCKPCVPRFITAYSFVKEREGLPKKKTRQVLPSHRSVMTETCPVIAWKDIPFLRVVFSFSANDLLTR